MSEFVGNSAPLSAEGFAAACDALRVGPAAIWAVLKVETSGCGFLADRRPQILFERHVFHRHTLGRFDAIAPDVSAPKRGGYGAEGAHQYKRLGRAIALHRSAALKSASWGIGQVMGNNAKLVGYADAESLVRAMRESEDLQLAALLSFCRKRGIDDDLRQQRWDKFASVYNGSGYAKHNYAGRLRYAFNYYSEQRLPDLRTRAAQVYLRYHGFDPGPVDGDLGKRTAIALKLFQRQAPLPENGAVDDPTLAALRQIPAPR
jgi:hypothetical protein